MKQEQLEFRKTLDVRYETDLLVAGAGPAGVAAAVFAARRGLRVRVIEAGSCLGGQGTSGLVPAFMTFTDGVNFLAGGFGRELRERMLENGGIFMPKDGSGRGGGIRVEWLKRLYEQMFEEAGVEYTYHTQLVDVFKEDESHVSVAIVAAKSGMYGIRAKVFVDGTGDGDLCVLSGAAYEYGDAEGNAMPGTLCTLWGGIDWNTVFGPEGRGYAEAHIEEAIRDGVFTLEDRHLPGIWRVGETIGGGNVGHTFGVNGTDEVSLTKAYNWARRTIREYETFYKKYMRGYEEMEFVMSAPLMGIRESRRITCDYTLNFEDFKARAVFPDEIGRYSYPIDIHIAKPDKASFVEHKKNLRTALGKGESYGIPYRSLLPRGLDNVWVAGRCIGVDRPMQASVRVMPCCYITGQAVGAAAAQYIRRGLKSIREVDTTALQADLKEAGAFLPNCP